MPDFLERSFNANVNYIIKQRGNLIYKGKNVLMLNKYDNFGELYLI